MSGSHSRYDPLAPIVGLVAICILFLTVACTTRQMSSAPTLTAPVAATQSGLAPAPNEVPSPSAPVVIVDKSQLLPSGIRIEEHPLIGRPDIEPLAFTGMDGQNEVQLLRTHASELHQRLRPESYYNICGCSLWVMQGNDKLETSESDDPAGNVEAGVMRNGAVIFAVPNDSPGVTSPFRVLAVYDDHWVVELAERKENSDTSVYFSGRVFVDGESLNDKYGYKETFGFQTIAGRPFYFYRQNNQLGVVADGQEVPLDYDEVPHYGCCSAGALNPRIARNMIAFFARRIDRWYYVEIGAFELDR